MGRGTLTKTELGCLKSHSEVLCLTDCELTLIFEDDFILCENFDSELKKCIDELPEDWEALWLCGKVIGAKQKHSENLIKIIGVVGAYGYLVHKSFLQKLVNELTEEKLIADFAMSRAFKKVYRSKKDLVKHRGGFSYIQNKMVNY